MPPVVGMAWVVDTDPPASGPAPRGVPSGNAAPSAGRAPVRTEPGVRSLMPVSVPSGLLPVTLGRGLVIIGRTGDCHDRHVFRQVHELDTHGRPVLVVPDAVDRRPDDAAAGGDGVQLVAELD